MKKKKIIILCIFIIIIIIFYSIYNSLNISKIDNLKTFQEKGIENNFFEKKLKQIVPANIKNYIKDTIFVFKKISILEQQLKDKNNLILELLNNPQPFEFKTNQIQNKKLNTINLKLTTFTSPLLKLTGPRAYLSNYKSNLFLLTGTGILVHVPLKKFNEEKLLFTKIETNLTNIIGLDYIKKKGGVVKGFLIKNKKIYVSFEKKINNECFTNSILVSNLNFDKMTFSEFFIINDCQPKYLNQVGGYLSNYKEDKILMTTGDFGFYENGTSGDNHPQNIKSLFGKIISIDENTREYKIISMGHRNPQGLYYDKNNDVIYSTEHGPQGGDEININISPGKEIKNYGWPISSYGEHYGYPEANNSEKYKEAPLNKSHIKYGFIEPLKYFTPSIAPTQIIKTEKFIKIENKNIIYIGSMGYPETIEEGDLSIHQFILSEDLKIEEHNIIPVHDRVRDIMYIEKLNKIFMFLESSGSIGVLEVNN